MTNKLLTKFRISDESLRGDPLIAQVYDYYSDKRYDLRELRKAVNEANKKLHDLLDGPLRLQELIPEDCAFGLTSLDLLSLITSQFADRAASGRPAV